MSHARNRPLVLLGFAGWTLLFIRVILVIFLMAPPVTGQTTGTIQGQVIDAAGGGLGGATVTVEPQDGGGPRVVTRTTEAGSFVQPGLAAGRSRVTAEKTGAGLQTFDVRLHPGHAVEVRFQLVPGRGASVMLEDENPENTAKLEKAFDAGLAAMRAGRYEEAAAGFREAIVISSRCHQCYYNLGIVGVQKREFPLAEESFRKAIDLKPDYVEAFNRLASVYIAQRRFVEAQAATREAERRSDGVTAVMSGTAATDGPYNEGIILWNLGKISEAREKFLEVLSRSAAHPDAHYWLAMADLNEGRLADATDGFDAYLRLAPSGPYAAEARQALAQIRR